MQYDVLMQLSQVVCTFMQPLQNGITTEQQVLPTKTNPEIHVVQVVSEEQVAHLGKVTEQS
jgi:hypothetical protein